MSAARGFKAFGRDARMPGRVALSRANSTLKRLSPLPWVLLSALCCAGEPAGSQPPATASPAAPTSPDQGPPVQHLAPAAPPQLHELQPGLWEYTRSQMRSGESRPHTQTIRRCSDPQSEFKAKMAELGARGCTFRPMKQHGSRYEMIWSCKMEADQTISMRDVITVTGPHGYRDESDAVVPQGATHTSLSAMRVGDCTPQDRAAPAPGALPPSPHPPCREPLGCMRAP